jgi:hypothetical protein
MKRLPRFLLFAALVGAYVIFGLIMALADPRPGTVAWSDGHTDQGDLSLTPGKQLRLFATDGKPYMLRLEEIREIRFTVESEEIWKGFYFPTSGQAVKAYTGDVYPIRHLATHITLNDGNTIEGHLFATVLYLDNGDTTQKIPIVAKQTGPDGEKLADMLYPIDIKFGSGAAAPSVSQIDLTAAGLKNPQPLVVVAKPNLAPVPAQQADGKELWTVSLGDPKQLFFSVMDDTGLHVAWPSDMAATLDPDIHQAAVAEVAAMSDFYDTRTLLGCVADGDDVYSLIMMKRMGDTAYMDAGKYPWSVVIIHSKYDADKKKMAALLDRATLIVSQTPRKTDTPPVIQEPDFLKAITVAPAPAATSTSNAAPAPNSTNPPGAQP